MKTKEMLDILRSCDSPVVTSHIQPDGDAVGSTVALLRALKRTGKEAHAISPSHIPSGLTFLMESEDEIVRYKPERDDPVLSRADLCIVVDCSSMDRTGEVGEKMIELGKPILVIDHHATNKGFGTWNHVRPEISSTGELLVEILEELLGSIPTGIAKPLYVGILTDTGGFNYPRTNRETHEKAGRLLGAGVRPYEIHRNLTLNRSVDFMRLAGLALFNTNLAYGGEVAVAVVQHDIFRRFTPRIDELTMLPPYLLAIRGVEVGALFLEDRPGRVVVELRSQGLVDVSSVARIYDGGGHSGAAGARIEGELPEILHGVLTEVKSLLDKAKRRGVSEKARSEILSLT